MKVFRDSSVNRAESWVKKVLAKQGGTAKFTVSSLQVVRMERFFY